VSRELVIQTACLYGPVVFVLLLVAARRPTKRQALGALFGLLWVAALLPWVDLALQRAGCWHYRASGPQLGGMPLSLFLGWAIAWGAGAPLLADALHRRRWIAPVILVLLDLRLMPELAPVLVLGPNWWLGELVLIVLLLLPALFLARATAEDRHLGARATLLIVVFGGVILGLPPLALFGAAAQQFITPEPWILACGLLFSIPGLAAVRDLAKSGRGTPVPLDPPRLLVQHGIYGFVRNPMQISMTALLTLEALVLDSHWPLVLAGLGIVYSEGFARWSENQDMLERFGSNWRDYQKHRRPWWPRWRPAPAPACQLWIDLACTPCGSIAHWFTRQCPSNLDILDAANFPGPVLTRITWRDPASGRTESGIHSIAMAWQHLTLPWAALGWLVALPGLSHLLQACLDVSGAGPRAPRS
jgi:protein-S-isoprenylcysteine O-methyltransferase Ste14